MYIEEHTKHNLPHIHAEYGEFNAVFDLDGNKLEGELPKKKEHLVVAWIEIHHEDLMADWKLVQKGDQYFKIAPLQ